MSEVDDDGVVSASEKTEASSTATTLPPETPEGDREAERDWRGQWISGRRWVVAGVILGLLAGIVVAGFLIRVPKVALKPGGIRATENLVLIDGAEEFESEGNLYYTTVRIPLLTVWEWMAASIDDASDVRDQEEIFGTQTPEENDLCNAQMMRTSKSTAVIVALNRLGFEPVSASGAAVERLVEDGAARSVIECGDVIVAVDGVSTLSSGALRDQIITRAPGDEIELTVENVVGEQRTESLTLGDNGEGQGLLGVVTGTRFDQNELPFDVDISTGNVGGPSAGLAFTLSILDKLTEGDLPGGMEVAITGTMRLDGTVGGVGGVRQKVIAARRGGADVFIMPVQRECDPELPVCARDEIYAGAGDMEIVEVGTLDEALAALERLGGDAVPVDGVALTT